MKKVFLSVLILVFSLSLVSCSQARTGEGSLAEEFTLSDINGNSISLSDYKDKGNILLFFWTTWCPFCRDELKKLDSQAETLAADGIEVLTINVGESRHKVTRYFEAHPVSFKALLDTDTEVSNSYGIGGVPTFFLVDKNGKVIYSGNYFPDDYNKITPQD
jgi:peroxiredoxin